MKLTNVQLINANNELGNLSQDKLNGGLAFRLFKLKQQLEQLVTPALQTLECIGYEDQSNPEFVEVLQIEQEFEPVATFASDDLNNLSLSVAQVAQISHFIKEKTEE